MAGEDTANGRLLARIDERTQRMDEKMDANHEEMRKRWEDHEDRIRGLEGSNRQGIFRDAGVMITAIVAAFLAWLTGKPS